MATLRKVLIFGNSILFASVENVLNNNPLLDVIRIKSSPIDTSSLLEHHPDVILFDLTSIEVKKIIKLTYNQAGIRVFGLDLAGGIAVELTEASHIIHQPEDLASLVIA